MAALCRRRGHSTLQLWFRTTFLLSFFLAYSQQSEIACLPYFHTWCGLRENLKCRAEMCCTRLAENTGCKSYAKNCHLHTIAQLCRAISLQLRHVSTIGRKLVKQQYLLHVSSQYGELPSTNGGDRLVGLGHPRKFQQVSHLGFINAPTMLNVGQPKFAQCTHTHNHFTALFLGPPRWAGARRNLLLDFYGARGDNRGRHINNHSIRTNQQPTSIIPPFYARCPSCCNPPTLSWLVTGTKYAGLHTQWHGLQ